MAQLSKWYITGFVHGLWSIQLTQTNDSGRTTYTEICILQNEMKRSETKQKRKQKQKYGFFKCFSSSKVTVNHITDIKITS